VGRRFALIPPFSFRHCRMFPPMRMQSYHRSVEGLGNGLRTIADVTYQSYCSRCVHYPTADDQRVTAGPGSSVPTSLHGSSTAKCVASSFARRTSPSSATCADRSLGFSRRLSYEQILWKNSQRKQRNININIKHFEKRTIAPMTVAGNPLARYAVNGR